MTKRDIAALFCRALSLTTFVRVITTAPSSLMMAVLASDRGYFGWTVGGKILFWVLGSLSQALLLVFAWYMWACADGIAAKMAPQSEEQQQALVVGPGSFSLVVSAMGLYALVRAVPEVGKVIGNMLSGENAALYGYRANGAPHIISMLMQIAVGFWLLLGASSVVRLLSFLAGRGVDEDFRKDQIQREESAEQIAPHV